MAVGSGSKQPPISRPTCSSNGSSISNGSNGPIIPNGLNGSGSLVLSSLLAPTSVSNGLTNGLAQSIATMANVTSSVNGDSGSPTNHMINGIQGGQGNSLKGFMMDRQQQQQQQQQQQNYMSGLSSPLPNLCVNSSLSQVNNIFLFLIQVQ